MAETQWMPPTGNAPQFGQDRPVTITAKQDNSVEVKFNNGRTIPDVEAIGPDSEPLHSWQQRNNIDTAKQVKLVKLAHMRYQHPDLQTITKFLTDFGMHVVKQLDDQVWYRGYGSDQYVYYARKGEKKFLGGTFEVESMAELQKAAKIPGAGQIIEMTEAPGAGHILTLHDPEGFPINLIYGQTPAPKGDLPEKVIYNYEGDDKPRVRKFNRFTPGPAAVHKLGHYGLCVQDFPTLLEWYTRNFNFAPTDFLHVPTGDGKTKDVAVFAHIDRGEDPVDHHTFFMSTNPTSHVHHSSFEVHDYDTQHLGHQWLGKQGYTSVWGIGRHILGSQVSSFASHRILMSRS